MVAPVVAGAVVAGAVSGTLGFVAVLGGVAVDVGVWQVLLAGAGAAVVAVGAAVLAVVDGVDVSVPPRGSAVVSGNNAPATGAAPGTSANAPVMLEVEGTRGVVGGGRAGAVIGAVIGAAGMALGANGVVTGADAGVVGGVMGGAVTADAVTSGADTVGLDGVEGSGAAASVGTGELVGSGTAGHSVSATGTVDVDEQGATGSAPGRLDAELGLEPAEISSGAATAVANPSLTRPRIIRCMIVSPWV